MDVRPFEPGGETSLEFFANKADASLFVLCTHSKKRPHNLTLGRFYDYQLYDMLELGVEQFKSLQSFGSAAAAVQAGNKVHADCRCCPLPPGS
jgi:ribosome production factor 2